MRQNVRIGMRFVLGALMVLGLCSLAAANGLQAQMHLGRMWTNPENDAAESDAIQFPAGLPKRNQAAGDMTTQETKRQWISHGQKSCSYLFTVDWADPENVVHEFYSSYYFRDGKSPYPKNWGEGRAEAVGKWVLPMAVQEYLRFARPPLYYAIASPAGEDSLKSFVFFSGPDPGGASNELTYPRSAGKGGHPWPIVDPNLVTEEKIRMVWRYIQGVEVTRDWYGWGYGTLHQDYYMQDTWLVNNGITGRQATATPIDTLTNQTLTGVIWAPGQDFKDKGMTGAQDGADEELMYVEPWGAGVHSAMLSFDGDADDVSVPGADWGDPDPVYWNQLGGNGYSIYGPVFASLSPNAKDTDDLLQPFLRIVVPEKGVDVGSSNMPTNAKVQREWMTDGLFHQPFDTRYQDTPSLAIVQSASAAGGPTAILGFGTQAGDLADTLNLKKHGWTLGPMDSMHVALVLACSGLDYEVARGVGERWAQRKADNPGNSSLWMSDADIALVQTGYDSVMKASALAWYNYYGAFAGNVTQDSLNNWGLDFLTPSWTKPAQYGRYNTPDGPRPPDFLAVTRVTSPANAIEVRWGMAAESDHDHDTNVNDFVGYRVIRWATSRYAVRDTIAQGLPATFPIAAAKVMPGGTVPEGRTFIDTDVVAGQEYWYAVVAYDDGSQNWEQPGNALSSTMWWTWSGYLFKGTVAPGGSVGMRDVAQPGRFVLEQNAPNPFNPSTTIRFSLATPGETKLVIYNTSGQVVRTLVDGNTPAGVHTVVWNGFDDTGRRVSSGMYVYRLVSGQNRTVRRMVLVR